MKQGISVTCTCGKELEKDSFPCSINNGEWCKKPFCKYVYYAEITQKFSLAADHWMRTWLEEAHKEIKNYRKKHHIIRK